MNELKSKLIEYKIKSITNNNINKVSLRSSSDSSKYFRKLYEENDDDINTAESVYILFLNRSSNVVGYTKLSSGGINASIIDIRLLSYYAINTLCSSVIMCHNHPSGNLNPSDADKKILNETKIALKIFGIHVLDNIILTNDSYYSFADEGIL